VKTVEGMSELQIPPGTQPGDVLVLAKKGAPKLNKPSIRGDHLFTIKVTIPKHVRYGLIFFLSRGRYHNNNFYCYVLLLIF
jgi:DnaJ-class molecular chaperone